jgi:urease accessory protein
MTSKRCLFAIPMLLVATPAFAHPGGHGPTGFLDGFLHPLGGLDHTLAMLAGGIIGIAGLEIPVVEAGIAASVVVLGAVLVVGRRCLLSMAVMLTGMFAIFHGYAHGAEMPGGAAAALYCLGFVSATALLNWAGLVLGLVTLGWNCGIRLMGAFVTIAGLVLSLS